MLSHDLDVDLGQVVNGERFTFSLVQVSLSLGGDLFEASGEVLSGLSLVLIVEITEESVVRLVHLKLDRVLVVLEESGVSVSEIGKVSTL